MSSEIRTSEIRDVLHTNEYNRTDSGNFGISCDTEQTEIRNPLKVKEQSLTRWDGIKGCGL